MTTKASKNLNRPTFRTAYDNEDWPGISFEGETSRTKQSDAEGCDINNILRGQAQPMIRDNPIFGDFADAPSYHEAMNLVRFAQEQFDSLPAQARARFNNDPETFLGFVNDPKNEKEMIELGLASAKPDLSPKQEPKDLDAGIPAPGSKAPDKP